MDGCIQEKTFFMEKVKLLICSQKMNRALLQTNLIYYYKQKEKQSKLQGEMSNVSLEQAGVHLNVTESSLWRDLRYLKIQKWWGSCKTVSLQSCSSSLEYRKIQGCGGHAGFFSSVWACLLQNFLKSFSVTAQSDIWTIPEPAISSIMLDECLSSPEVQIRNKYTAKYCQVLCQE